MQRQGADKRKRMVVYFSPDQRESLERYFETWKGDIGPEEKETIAVLANEIGLTPQQIRGWLRNRKLRGIYKGKTVHHPDQIRALEWLYSHHSKYPPTDFKKRLAERLGMTYKQVKKWYQSRRQKSEPSPVVDTEPENPAEWAALLASLRDLMRASEDEGFRADTSCKRRRISETETLPCLSHQQPPTVRICDERPHYIPPANSAPEVGLAMFSSNASAHPSVPLSPSYPSPPLSLASSPSSSLSPPPILSPIRSQPMPRSGGLESFGSSSLPLPSLSQTLPSATLSSPLAHSRSQSVSPRTSTQPLPQNDLLPPLHVLMRRASGSS